MTKVTARPFSTTRRLLLGLAATALLSAGQAWAQTPTSGGVLRIAYPEAPDSLDPQTGVSLSAHQLTSMIYETLTVLDQDGLPQPRLAQSWEPIDGGKSWRITLRQGVKFHHGEELTAADVVATVERAENPALAVASKGGFGPIASVVAEGRYTVVFNLTTPFAELPVVLASPLKALIFSASKGGDLVTAPSGTGPFVFDSFSPGEGASVKRNPDYWDAGLPLLDGVQLQSIKDGVSQQSALRSQQTDIITLVSPETALVLSRTPDVAVHKSPYGSYQSLVMQADLPPFDNPKVREAFKYILDREALLTSALFGQGSLGADATLPGGSPFTEGLSQPKQDLAKARALLDEAGIGELSLNIYATSDRPPSPKFALAFSEAASKIGVQLKVVDVPYAEYAADVMRKQPLYIANMPVSPTAFDAIYRIYHSKGAMNYGKAEQTPGLDQALEVMIGKTDPAERAKLASEALALLQGPSERLIPYFINAVVASSPKVRDLHLPRAYSVIDMTSVWLEP